MVGIFIALQISLLLFIALHDWITLPPFNDIPALKTGQSFASRLQNTIINSMLVLIPLTLTIIYAPMFPLWAILTIVLFYAIGTCGTICAWWMPYFLGCSEKYAHILRKYDNTHHFLPARGKNIVPNTLHVILHIQVWLCLLIALYLLFMLYL